MLMLRADSVAAEPSQYHSMVHGPAASVGALGRAGQRLCCLHHASLAFQALGTSAVSVEPPHHCADTHWASNSC